MGILKRIKDKVANFFASVGNGAKALVVAGSTALATSAKAAVTFNETTGFSGSIDTVYFTSAIVLLVSFLGIALAIGYGIRALKKG